MLSFTTLLPAIRPACFTGTFKYITQEPRPPTARLQTCVMSFSAQQFPLGIATPSLGMSPKHTLPMKLKAAAQAGFSWIELGFDDLLAWTLHEHPNLKPLSPSERAEWAPDEPDPFGEGAIWSAVKRMAKEMGAKEGGLCHQLGLRISILQPFSQFEGWPAKFKRRKWVYKKAEHWLEVAEIAGAKGLQVGSTDAKDTIKEFGALAKDLGELADMAAKRGLEVSYEPWCWGVHAPTWETTWELVKRADRPNLGLCLDTFQIPGGPGMADPSSSTGWVTTSPFTGSDGRAVLRESLQRLSKSGIPPNKIHLLQVSDARKVSPPLGQGGKDDDEWQPGMQAREVWSHGCRPPPGLDGYLPVAEVAAATFATGFRGLLSYEVFELAQQSDDLNVPAEWANRCMNSNESMIQAAARVHFA